MSFRFSYPRLLRCLVELRGFEPRTSAVQRRRSPDLSYSPSRKLPPGGRSWIRTTGLTLIRGVPNQLS